MIHWRGQATSTTRWIIRVKRVKPTYPRMINTIPCEVGDILVDVRNLVSAMVDGGRCSVARRFYVDLSMYT